MSAYTPSEKATLFNNYFFSVYTQPRVRANLPTVSIYHHDLLGTTIIQVDEVLKILKKLDVSKAIGPDGLSPRVLKECCHQIASPLCYIFSVSLAAGKLPSQWLDTNGVPALKKVFCGKVMERAIFDITGCPRMFYTQKCKILRIFITIKTLESGILVYLGDRTVLLAFWRILNQGNRPNKTKNT